MKRQDVNFQSEQIESWTFEEVQKASLEYFHGDELAASTFATKYALRDQKGRYRELTPDMMHRRLAKEFARIEAKFPNSMSEEQIFNFFDHFKYLVPQGSPMSAIGNDYQIQSTSNCFVIDSPKDSYGGILFTDQEQVQIMKRRGGVGFDISTIRPRGLITKNAAQTTDGIGVFMDRFSNSCREVAQGGRRGALMLTISVHHPQIQDFIDIKRDLTRVTGANISVRLSDEFLEAVEKNENYRLSFPVDATPEEAQICDWVSARETWDSICESAHHCAEPGLLFWDNYRNNTPSDLYPGFESTSTNPCSEIGMNPNDSCRLLLLNVISFIQDPFVNPVMDWKKFEEYANFAQRLMDDMVEIELEKIDKILAKIEADPEPDAIKRIEKDLWEKIRFVTKTGRRTGLGVTAIGDAVAMMNLKYGSPEAIAFVERVYRTLAKGSYTASVLMAEERGAFPIWDLTREENSEFLNRVVGVLDPEIQEKYRKFGRRNIANTTTAPAGSVSILTQTTSGIEPVFLLEYERRKKINPTDSEARVDYVDPLGDKWTVFKVRHHGVKRWMDATGKTKLSESPYFGATANELDWESRVDLQAACQRWVCHAISSCLVAGESKILTSQGLLDIEELAGHAPLKEFAPVDFEVSSINKENERARITQGYNNGVAKVLDLHFPNGFVISCTPNHRLAVLDKEYSLSWKKAGELQLGDVVVGRKGLNLWSTSSSYLSKLVGSSFSYERHGNSKALRLPRKMSPSLARFLGYLCSDGFFNENSIGLSQVPNNASQDFEQLVENLFGLTAKEFKDPRTENLSTFTVNSRELVAFVKWLGICHHDELKVPLAIRRSGKQTVKEFVRGLTLDGHVSEQHLCVMTSICRSFLQDVQQLLLNLGIETSLQKAHNKAFRKFPNSEREYLCKESWSLLITHSGEATRYLHMVGFAEERKQEEGFSKFRRQSRKKLCGEVPDFGLRKKFRDNVLSKISSNKFYESANSLTSKDKQGRWLCRESIRELEDLGLDAPQILTDNTYVFRPLKEILDGGERPTFDVEVPQGNAYIANGFISHNTVNIPKKTSVDEVKKIYMRAWKSGCKGITVYRDGSRSGVLVSSSEEDFIVHDAPRRPDKLLCDIHQVKIRGEDWTVFVGLMQGKPYEIFGGRSENIELPKKLNQGVISKRRLKTGGKYDLLYGDPEDPNKIKDIVRMFDNPNQGAFTRILSLSLRHGAPIQYVVEQLQRDKASDMFSFARVIARVLKKYIPDGTMSSDKICPECGAEDSLKYQEGCVACVSCGYTKCS